MGVDPSGVDGGVGSVVGVGRGWGWVEGLLGVR